MVSPGVQLPARLPLSSSSTVLMRSASAVLLSGLRSCNAASHALLLTCHALQKHNTIAVLTGLCQATVFPAAMCRRSIEEWAECFCTCSLILCQGVVFAVSGRGVKLLLRQPSPQTVGRAALASRKVHLWRLLHLVHANSMLRMSCLIGLARLTTPLTVISLPACIRKCLDYTQQCEGLLRYLMSHVPVI